MPTCPARLRVLRASYPTCYCVSRVICPSCFRASLASCPTCSRSHVFRTLCAFVSHVLHALRALCPACLVLHVLPCLMCLSCLVYCVFHVPILTFVLSCFHASRDFLLPPISAAEIIECVRKYMNGNSQNLQSLSSN